MNQRPRPEISIILPTYNERESLPRLVEQLAELNLGLEIVVIDDASPDGTAEVVQELARRYPVRLIRRSGKLGLASAILKGLSGSQGSIMVVMDADLSHDVAAVPRLVKAVRDGADLAVGSRYVKGGGTIGWPLRRQWMSLAATAVGRLVFGLREHDPMSGFFAVRRAVFDRLKSQLRPQGYKLLMEILVRGRPLKTIEISYIFQDRVYGKSKISWTIAWQYLNMMLTLLLRKRSQ